MATSTKTGLRTAELPAVDRVQNFQSAEAIRAWEQMRHVLNTRFGKGGQPLDKAVTWGDMVENGLVKWRSPSGKVISGPGSGQFLPPEVDVPDGIPPAPVGVTVTPGLATVIIEWQRPTFSYFGHAEVWRSTSNNLANAVALGQTTSWTYADPVGSTGTTYYYWVRFVSAGGKPGPFNGVGGQAGEVSLDPAYLIDVLSADDPKALLWELAEETLINGVLCPPGVYVRDLYLANGIISRAKIGLAAIDDARIANLSAAKVTFGEMLGDRIAVNSLNANRLTVDTLAARMAIITDAYVKSANIQFAAVQDAHIANLNASKITAGFLDAARLAAGSVSADKLSVSSLSAITAIIGVLRTAISGARLEIRDNLILVFDGNNVLRMRIGIW